MALVKQFSLPVEVKVFSCQKGGFLAKLNGFDDQWAKGWGETEDKAVAALYSQVGYKTADKARGPRTFQIWSEGYAATGESGGAMHHGEAQGVDFKSACIAFAANHADFNGYFDANQLTFWGCKLFDNAGAARKSFG